MKIERAIEILNPEHREHYDSIETELKPNADISVWKWERYKKRLEEMEGK